MSFQSKKPKAMEDFDASADVAPQNREVAVTPHGAVLEDKWPNHNPIYVYCHLSTHTLAAYLDEKSDPPTRLSMDITKKEKNALNGGEKCLVIGYGDRYNATGRPPTLPKMVSKGKNEVGEKLPSVPEPYGQYLNKDDLCLGNKPHADPKRWDASGKTLLIAVCPVSESNRKTVYVLMNPDASGICTGYIFDISAVYFRAEYRHVCSPLMSFKDCVDTWEKNYRNVINTPNKANKKPNLNKKIPILDLLIMQREKGIEDTWTQEHGQKALKKLGKERACHLTAQMVNDIHEVIYRSDTILHESELSEFINIVCGFLAVDKSTNKEPEIKLMVRLSLHHFQLARACHAFSMPDYDDDARDIQHIIGLLRKRLQDFDEPDQHGNCQHQTVKIVDELLAEIHKRSKFGPPARDSLKAMVSAHISIWSDYVSDSSHKDLTMPVHGLMTLLQHVGSGTARN